MDRVRRDRLASVAAVVVGVVVLMVIWWVTRPADDRDDDPGEPVTVSPSVSGSVGTRPVRPGPFETATPAGVEATLRFYYDALNFAQFSGDVSALDDVFDSSCGQCQNIRDAMVELHKDGRRLEGGGYTVTAITDIYTYPTNNGIPTMTATAIDTRAAATFHRGDGSTFASDPEKTETALFLLEFHNGYWTIVYLGAKD